MPRAKTPSFITEVPLVVSSKEDTELLSRFHAGRQLYNALLNEAMVRVNLVRNSELFKHARKMVKGKARNDAFQLAKTQQRYSEFELMSFATQTAKSAKWIAEKIDSATQQKLATRAFQASEKVLFGRAKKVRFKVPNRFNSLEGKSNKQGIRWSEEQLIWGKLRLDPIIDESNLVLIHGLTSSIKYVRILKRDLNGKRRWFAQLICEGLPYQKSANFVNNGIVGIDLNISNVAYVADNNAGLLPFADKVPVLKKQVSKIQKKMQRSQRLANPDNYEPDFPAKRGRKVVIKKGKNKKGVRKWNKTKNYQRLAAKKRELERRRAAYAKSKNRELANDILRNGNNINAENVSAKGWQKRYGKSISAKSPGFFQSELKRKAESAGGSFTRFSTRKTALSQTHLTGERIKKSLSERVHYDQTGIVMQRDLFSAYLARYVDDDELTLQNAQTEYLRLEPVLLAAWQRSKINCERVVFDESRLTQPPLEQFANHDKRHSQIGELCSDRKAV
jgi:putative transposase